MAVTHWWYANKIYIMSYENISVLVLFKSIIIFFCKIKVFPQKYFQKLPELDWNLLKPSIQSGFHMNPGAPVSKIVKSCGFSLENIFFS